MFREEVNLLPAIQHLPASTDPILTEVLKAILYLQVEVWKDQVHLHMEALLQAAAGHTAEEENPEDLIHPDLHQVLHRVVLHRVVLPRVEVVLLPQVAAVDRADVSLKQ